MLEEARARRPLRSQLIGHRRAVGVVAGEQLDAVVGGVLAEAQATALGECASTACSTMLMLPSSAFTGAPGAP